MEDNDRSFLIGPHKETFVAAHFWTRSALSVLLLTTAALAQNAAPTPKTNEPAGRDAASSAPTKEAGQAQAAASLTAQDHLDACRKLYAAAKTYRDEGKVETVIDTGPQKLAESKRFATAFERDGRFRWQLEHSAMPGHKPDQKFIVWSNDQKSFGTSWTLTSKNDTFTSIDLAMAGPTSASGGSASAVIPLLRPDAHFPLRSTSLRKPEIIGTDKLDDAQCTMIRGTEPLTDATVVLWLDPDHAIRRIKSNMDVDPSKAPGGGGASSKFKVETIINLKPVFDEKIDDKYFEPKDSK